MRRLATTIALLAIAFSHYAALGQDLERVKEFPSERCKLTLPAPDFVWIDPKLIPGTIAVMTNASGTVINLLATRAPNNAPFDQTTAEVFEQGMLQSGDATKISAEFTTFRGVSCYQIHVRLKQNGLPAMMRVFAANGYLYQVQLIGSNLPIDDPAKLEDLFSAFDFIGAPRLHQPAPKSAVTKSLEFSEWMGRVVGVCIIAIIVILPVRYFLRRGKKAAQSVAPEDGAQEDGEG